MPDAFVIVYSLACKLFINCVFKSPEEKVIAVGLADGRTVIHNILYDQTVMTVKQDWGEVTAISFRTGWFMIDVIVAKCKSSVQFLVAYVLSSKQQSVA